MNRASYNVFYLLVGLFLLSIVTGCSSAEFVFFGVIKKTYSGKAGATVNTIAVGNDTIKVAGHYKGTSLDSASISGLVVAPDSSLLSYAQVSFKPSGSSMNEPWITFETDDQGRFVIVGIASGDYEIACLYPQYYLKLVSGVRARKSISTPEFEVVFILDSTYK